MPANDLSPSQAGSGQEAHGLSAAPALAHPHVWVTASATVLYEHNTITGLQQAWTFDEFYAAMAIEGLDKNNDGVYDREELAPLAKVNIDGIKEFDYFTYATADGRHVAVGAGVSIVPVAFDFSSRCGPSFTG